MSNNTSSTRVLHRGETCFVGDVFKMTSSEIGSYLEMFVRKMSRQVWNRRRLVETILELGGTEQV